MRRNVHGAGLALALALVSLVGSISPPTASAQGVDTRGTEFMIAFLPINGFDEKPVYHIGVSATRPTTGTLTYMVDGSRVPISIPAADRVVWVEVDRDKMAPTSPVAGVTSNRSLKLAFSDPVQVIGSNSMRWSGDAFLSLPVDALGLDYYVLAYPNTRDPNVPGETSRVSDFPSQFGIVAASQGTTRVTITPSTAVNGKTEQFSISLAEGQVFIGQANKVVGSDVTGTRITSDRPIVVYGGHQRTNIPFNEAIGRDHLVEQMLPIKRWKNDAIVTPFVDIGRTMIALNIFRVIATENETLVSIDGVPALRLDAGQLSEIAYDRPHYINATGPILVAQFHGSAVDERFTSQFNDSIGDPTMILAPSPSQFDTSYSFTALPTVNYQRHFINVTTASDNREDLYFDGLPFIYFTEFFPVGTSGYSVARLEVTEGPHHIRSPRPFGLIAYGYGPYTSYGYPCGFVLERPPAAVDPVPLSGSALALVLSPNPSIGSATTLSIRTQTAGALRVEIVDPLGRVVAVPVEREYLAAGEQAFEIATSELPAGSYQVRARTGSKVIVEKMVIVR